MSIEKSIKPLVIDDWITLTKGRETFDLDFDGYEYYSATLTIEQAIKLAQYIFINTNPPPSGIIDFKNISEDELLKLKEQMAKIPLTFKQ